MNNKPIQVTNVRLKDGDAFRDTRQRTIVDAWQYLIRSEIGFGSKVTVAEPTKVETFCSFMGCQDTTTFLGSEDDMRLLYEGAVLARQIREVMAQNVFTEHALAKANFPAAMQSMFRAGLATEKLVLVALLARAFPEAEQLTRLKTEDLSSLVELVKIDKVPLDDALALA